MSGLAELDTLFAPAASEPLVALAVSGGADSLALMLLAARWASGPARPRLVVYSVDHRLRPEATDEVRMVLEEAGRLGLSSRGLSWDGPKPTAGIQAAARLARYGLMREAMAADGASLLLTAHHLRDQAETVLMRLAHGSGPEGLRGMDPFSTVEGVRIFRPFLGVDPDHLRSAVAEAGLVPAHDPSNDDEHYERVRWRKALPLFADLGLTTERLGTLSRRMSEVSDLLTTMTDDAEVRLVVSNADEARLDWAAFRKLPSPVATRLLVRVLQQPTALKRAAPLEAVEALRDALKRGEVTTRTLHGCVVTVWDNSIIVRREKSRTAALRALSNLTPN